MFTYKASHGAPHFTTWHAVTHMHLPSLVQHADGIHFIS
jgi:cytochrome b-561 domain containing protein 2